RHRLLHARPARAAAPSPGQDPPRPGRDDRPHRVRAGEILNRPPRLLLLLFVLVLPLVTPKIRAADEIEYFAYLRSLVFDHDLEFGNEYQHFYDLDPKGLAGFKATFLDLREARTGRHINFGPLGSALLWSPFYLLAHLGVRLFGG